MQPPSSPVVAGVSPQFGIDLIAMVSGAAPDTLERVLAAWCREAFFATDAWCLVAGPGENERIPTPWRPLAVLSADREEVSVCTEGNYLLCVLSLDAARNLVIGMEGAADDATAAMRGLGTTLAKLAALRLDLDCSRRDSLRAGQLLDQHRQMLDRITSSVIGMDLGGYITSWNRGAELLFGYAAEEAIGKNILFLYADEDEEDLISRAFLEQGVQEMVVRRRKRSGEEFWASLSLSLLVDGAGLPTGIIGYLVDITDRIRSEEQLRLQAAIFEYSGEGIVVTDARDRIVSINRAFTRITGYVGKEVLGQSWDILRSRFHDIGFYRGIRETVEEVGYWVGEAWSTRKGGETFPVWQSVSAVRNPGGALTHYFIVFSDVSDRKNAEQQIYRLAYFDTLTGLPNRSMVYTLLRQALEEGRRNGKHGAVLFIDIDRFKRVNDILGVAAGDQLLAKVAGLVRGCLRSEDVVARCGADEFIVALFDLARREHAATVATKIQRVMANPVCLDDGNELFVSASIGISIFPDDGDDPETLVRNASIAMSRVKQGEGHEEGFLFFSPEMNQRALERHRLEEDLRRSIEREELRLYFQPQFNADGGKIIGAEVLLRWMHGDKGMVSPGEFIPVAEESGLINVIGDWVLETACRKNRGWQEQGIPVVKLAVNISARQFRPALANQVAKVLSDTGMSPDLLELEITENTLMRSIDAVVSLLDEFRRLGVTIALDDFGTGYSSLAYLKSLPIDTLKIDQSFVQGLPGDGNDAAIVLAIIDLAKNLGLKVIAEGVERPDQLEFLRNHACDEIQGFCLARPMPEDAFVALLRESADPVTILEGQHGGVAS